MTAVTDEDQGNDSGTRKADGRWDDGLIARRAAAAATRGTAEPVPRAPADDEPDPQVEAYAPADGPLPTRLDALRELVGLSRARLDRDTLAEAGRVLDEAAARQRLSSRHTVIAVAGATGSGKSTLFNALAGATISDTGLRRPTTSQPIACSWTDGAAGLLDRLAVPRAAPQAAPRARRLRRGAAGTRPGRPARPRLGRHRAPRTGGPGPGPGGRGDLGRRSGEVRRRRPPRTLSAPARLPRRGHLRRPQPDRPAARRGGRPRPRRPAPPPRRGRHRARRARRTRRHRHVPVRAHRGRRARTPRAARPLRPGPHRRHPPPLRRRRRGGGPAAPGVRRRRAPTSANGRATRSRTGWPRRSARQPPGRPPSGSGDATRAGPAGRRGCGSGAGTRTGACPAAWTGWARRSPRPRRS